MAEVIVLHNQADHVEQAKSNLPARAIGWAKGERVLVFQEDLGGGEKGQAFEVPSTVGQGMGRRVTKAAHGFSVGQAVRLTNYGSVSRYQLAAATPAGDNLATHLVVAVPSADQFDVASTGTWRIGGSPKGVLYLSDTPGALTTVRPSGVVAQQVAIGDSISYHIGMSLDRRISVSTEDPTGEPAEGDLWIKVAS